MGSIADEMKKVLQMWDEEDQSQQEEIKVVNTTEIENKKSSITARILAIIESNPGITGIGLRDKLSTLHPDIPEGFSSSMLKQFTDRCYVTRTIAPERVGGRSVFAYTIIPEAERKALQKKLKEDHKKAVARAAHARAMKEQKKAMKEMPDSFVPYEKQSISDLVEKFKANSTKVEQPTEWSVDDVLDSLTVKQARALHIALKEMFGG
jgi:hypothetical protein